MLWQRYGGTLRYDIRAELEGEAKDLSAYKQDIPAQKVEGIMETAVSVIKGKNDSQTAQLSVVEKNQELIDLGTVPLPDNGIIMTEKLASVTGVQAGDTLTLKLPGSRSSIELKIVRLVHMGIGQGLYMSVEQWESLGQGGFAPTALLIKGSDESYVDYLMQSDEVDKVTSISAQREQALKNMESTNSIIALMTIFAFSLALVVFYNMGILNFMERTREYATLKVLGYYQKEIRSLIVKENMIISCIGVVAGILPGVWLTSLVVHAGEADSMSITPYVSALSIGIACVLTLIFSLIIQLLLTNKVKSVDMVEALKSVE